MMFKVMLESIKFNEKLCVLIEMAEGVICLRTITLT